MSESDTIVDEEVLEEAEFDFAMEGLVGEASNALPDASPTLPPANPEQEKKSETTFTQWALGGNGRFSPVGAAVPTLPAGLYEPFAVPGSWGVERLSMSSDEIYELPDMATNRVLAEVEQFWNSEEKYRKHNLLYKRGIILYGPPGSGKSIAVKLLTRKLIERDGIVILAHNVPLSIMCLKAIRRIEPTRNLICVFEDIDEIMQANGESVLLSMLDGEHNLDRVLNIATTNFADRLGARIINRPSRFDRRELVDMPSPDARRYYLVRATAESLSEDDLNEWTIDTAGMSIAHLRELVAAVYCLDQPYSEVIDRLKDMAAKVKAEEEFKSNRMGFTSGTKAKTSVSW